MPSVYEVYVETHFSAAHSLTGYQGDCARLHGHNWVVVVHVRCAKLDEIGIGVDFREIRKTVKKILARMDHMNLNELTEFQGVNPTSENIAAFLFREIGKELNTRDIRVSRVRVSETPGAGAVYWEE